MSLKPPQQRLRCRPMIYLISHHVLAISSFFCLFLYTFNVPFSEQKLVLKAPFSKTYSPQVTRNKCIDIPAFGQIFRTMFCHFLSCSYAFLLSLSLNFKLKQQYESQCDKRAGLSLQNYRTSPLLCGYFVFGLSHSRSFSLISPVATRTFHMVLSPALSTINSGTNVLFIFTSCSFLPSLNLR